MLLNEAIGDLASLRESFHENSCFLFTTQWDRQTGRNISRNDSDSRYYRKRMS